MPPAVQPYQCPLQEDGPPGCAYTCPHYPSEEPNARHGSFPGLGIAAVLPVALVTAWDRRPGMAGHPLAFVEHLNRRSLDVDVEHRADRIVGE